MSSFPGFPRVSTLKSLSSCYDAVGFVFLHGMGALIMNQEAVFLIMGSGRRPFRGFWWLISKTLFF